MFVSYKTAVCYLEATEVGIILKYSVLLCSLYLNVILQFYNKVVFSLCGPDVCYILYNTGFCNQKSCGILGMQYVTSTY